jgi:hypothetical protein
VPPETIWTPTIERRGVVLPPPLGPSRPTTWPRGNRQRYAGEHLASAPEDAQSVHHDGRSLVIHRVPKFTALPA